MTRKTLLTIGLLAACLSGCPHNRYVIEMTPRGAFIERKLTVSREGTGEDDDPNVPGQEAAHLAGAYKQAAPPKPAPSHTFAGRFSGKLPDDVGGAGSCTHLTTRMGSAWIYVERFRGNDDLIGQLGEIHGAADRLADLLIGWFQAELGGDKRFKVLREFMDKNLRKDLKNLGTYAWLEEMKKADQGRGEDGQASPVQRLLARMGQYLIEREYFAPAELGKLARLAGGTEQADESLALLQRLVTTRMGIPEAEPIPKSLHFLVSAEAAGRSFVRYVRTTKQYKKWLATTRPPEEQDQQDLPHEFFNQHVGGLFAFDIEIAGTDDRVVCKLALPERPVHTNGQWDEKAKTVSWHGAIKPRNGPGHRMPLLFYAVWGQADERFQERHFGKVAVGAQSLFEYCLWRVGLSEQEAKEWDAFLESLRPGKSLESKLGKFLFSHERGKKEPSDSLAAPAVRLIEDGLKKNAKKAKGEEDKED